eukprot:TRINITY_DN94208_c0_g1_i1.p1 TRINITY_DN94208_c0_g1~~TRINITY_DN94208_c0_g1_i1.p1  ORF type:complete len:412 (-),score=79.64 TRINITY_DN94208_c0_g1_i1:24-1199(-)
MASRLLPPPPPTRRPPGEDLISGKPLRFLTAWAGRQHPLKQQQKYVYADAVSCSSKWLGVCDGVSGVQKMGYSPDALPHELLDQCQKVMAEQFGVGSNQGSCDGAWLLSVLQAAFAATSSIGATTVLLAGIEDCQRMAVGSVGDCALLLLRPSQSFELCREFRSQKVMYGNAPTQVVRLPRDGAIREFVESCYVDTVHIRHGDLLVLGSDGIFDNLTDEEVTGIVQRICAPSRPECRNLVEQMSPLGTPAPLTSVIQLQCAAKSLVDAAIENAYPEPVSRPAGGGQRNPDDTTCIVALVVEEQGPMMEPAPGSDTEEDTTPVQEGMLQKATVCTTKVKEVHSTGGLSFFPECCQTACIEEDFEEASEEASAHDISFADGSPVERGQDCSIS